MAVRYSELRAVPLLLLALAGCPSDQNYGDVPKESGTDGGGEPDEPDDESDSSTGEEDCISEVVDVTCPEEATCDQALDLSQVVMDCYWDEESGTWGADTPTEIAEQCLPDQPCTVVIAENQPLYLVDSCTGSCIDLCDRAPEDCCHWSMPTAYYDDPLAVYWNDVYDPFVAQIHADCETNGLFDVSLDYCPDETRNEPPPTVADCHPGAMLLLPDGANLLLTVDPDASFLGIWDSGVSLETSVMGSCAAQSQPAQFMRGMFWVEDTTFGELEIRDWAFSFNSPITPNTGSGTFMVPVAEVNQAAVVGHGLVGTSPVDARVRLAKPAVGTLSVEEGTWSLHYEQIKPNGDGIVLHLQGPAEQVDS